MPILNLNHSVTDLEGYELEKRLLISQYLVLCPWRRAKREVLSVADGCPTPVVRCAAVVLLAVFGSQLVLNVRQL